MSQSVNPFLISLLLLAVSCKTEERKSEEVKPIDSISINEAAEAKRVEKVRQSEQYDYIADSLSFTYSIDAAKILNKTILLDNAAIDDIFIDKDGIHLVLHERIGSEKSYINLSCTDEQLDLIQNEIKKNKWLFYLTMSPEYVRKINQTLYAYFDENEENEKDKAYIEMEGGRDIPFFIVKGRLININSIK